MSFANIQFHFLLFGAAQYMKMSAMRHKLFANQLRKKDCTVQIKVLDNSAGRYYVFKSGRVTSKAGILPAPDVCMGFSDVGLGMRLLVPWRDRLEMMDAMKNFS
jgi:hypothetical protein